MSVPARAQDYKLFMAIRDNDGVDRFVDHPGPAVAEQEGAFEAAWFWETSRAPRPDDFGAPATVPRAAGRGGSSFGLMRFPAKSSGKLDVANSSGGANAEAGFEDPSMHRTETLDYEIILSGKVDFVLPNGDKRTLGVGDMILVAGALHAWRNDYDEDCIYAAVTIGMSE